MAELKEAQLSGEDRRKFLELSRVSVFELAQRASRGRDPQVAAHLEGPDHPVVLELGIYARILYRHHGSIVLEERFRLSEKPPALESTLVRVEVPLSASQAMHIRAEGLNPLTQPATSQMILRSAQIRSLNETNEALWAAKNGFATTKPTPMKEHRTAAQEDLLRLTNLGLQLARTTVAGFSVYNHTPTV